MAWASRRLKPARRPADEHVHHHFLGLSAERVFQHNHLFNMIIRKKATHIKVSRLSHFVIPPFPSIYRRLPVLRYSNR